jgi:hypothetical protein
MTLIYLLVPLLLLSFNRHIIPSNSNLILVVVFIDIIDQGLSARGHRVLEGVAVHPTKNTGSTSTTEHIRQISN